MAVLDRTRTPVEPSAAPGRAAGGLGAGLALAALATVVWSGSFVTARGLHDSVPPVQHAFWRWVIAIVALAPFGIRAAWRERALLRSHLTFVTLAALLGVTVYNTLVNQAGLTTSAGNMGMIMAASPVLMAVYERAGGARLGARRVTGTLLACAGVVLLVSKGSLTPDFAPGDLWVVAAAVCFGSYSALLRRRPPELGGVPFLFATFVLGTLMLLPAYVVSVWTQGGFEVRPGTVGPLSYVGVVSSAIAFFAWNKAIALVGAARAGVVYYLQPVCVALLSYAVLGESMGWMRVGCMVLILGGVVLASVGRGD
ncbi:DMT family transporter [Streptomyces sp. VRA16 Mangrove soil]|uniref:DMT family transporter n=1 Tax=Streptomyces sp. VRA16 Mangrove soil TaxID=2817434 RepID=UPI001A9E41C8|nr:DMT family transporter [Streptomyces sp. VRA16 Mangrove soil]MBO1334016.1 DMT family transporter [Streptomyces sp. VRA16 Mangrove soil]